MAYSSLLSLSPKSLIHQSPPYHTQLFVKAIQREDQQVLQNLNHTHPQQLRRDCLQFLENFLQDPTPSKETVILMLFISENTPSGIPTHLAIGILDAILKHKYYSKDIRINRKDIFQKINCQNPQQLEEYAHQVLNHFMTRPPLSRESFLQINFILENISYELPQDLAIDILQNAIRQEYVFPIQTLVNNQLIEERHVHQILRNLLRFPTFPKETLNIIFFILENIPYPLPPDLAIDILKFILKYECYLEGIQLKYKGFKMNCQNPQQLEEYAHQVLRALMPPPPLSRESFIQIKFILENISHRLPQDLAIDIFKTALSQGYTSLIPTLLNNQLIEEEHVHQILRHLIEQIPLSKGSSIQIYFILENISYGLPPDLAIDIFKATLNQEYTFPMRTLFQNKLIDINYQDSTGQTFLHRTIEHGNPIIIHDIISFGANPLLKNNKGQTPLDLLIEKDLLGSIYLPPSLIQILLSSPHYIQMTLQKRAPDSFQSILNHTQLTHKQILEFAELAADNGLPLTLIHSFIPHIPRPAHERLFQKATINYNRINFVRECRTFWDTITSEMLIRIYKDNPHIIEWINFKYWPLPTNTLMEFMEFLDHVVKNNPQKPLIHSFAIDIFQTALSKKCYSIIQTILKKQLIEEKHIHQTLRHLLEPPTSPEENLDIIFFILENISYGLPQDLAIDIFKTALSQKCYSLIQTLLKKQLIEEEHIHQILRNLLEFPTRPEENLDIIFFILENTPYQIPPDLAIDILKSDLKHEYYLEANQSTYKEDKRVFKKINCKNPQKLEEYAHQVLRHLIKQNPLSRKVFTQIYFILENTSYGLAPDLAIDIFKIALNQGRTFILKALFENNLIDINYQDSMGQTFLHRTIEDGDIHSIYDIIDFGANPLLENNKGKTPLDLLIEKDLLGFINPPLSLIETLLSSPRYIQMTLQKGAPYSFQELLNHVQLTQKKALEFAELAANSGLPLTLIHSFFPHIPKHDHERLFQKAIINYNRINFVREYRTFWDTTTSEMLIKIYKENPHLIEWMNFRYGPLPTNTLMEFLDHVVKNNPQKPLILSIDHEYSWDFNFLMKILKKFPTIKSLPCSKYGSALSFFIHERCLSSNAKNNYDPLILMLIDRNCDVNEDTPIGKPLNHLLYMLSGNIKTLDEDEIEDSLIVVDALLKQYEKSDSKTKGSLNPKQAEMLHSRSTGNKMGEYMQTPLGSTLALGSPSKKLYDTVKEFVDLREVNDHGRNFIHHLALLEQCFENKLNELFLRRKYTAEDKEKSINLQDNDGMTPLMYATRNPDFFKHLLDCGANTTLTDKRGFAIEHHLLIHGKDEVIKIFLREKGIYFSPQDEGILLKRRLNIRMENRLTLGITFEEQLKELCNPSEIVVGHRKKCHPQLAILSTCFHFPLILKEGLDNLIGHAEHYRDIPSPRNSLTYQSEEEQNDRKARLFLSTGTASYFYDGSFFVTKTYALLDPFHVCEAYGRYAPDFSFPLRSQSDLLDGFKRVFTKTLKKEEKSPQWNRDKFKRSLRKHRRILLMSQEYIIPFVIQQILENSDQKTPIIEELILFFEEEMPHLKDHIQKLLTFINSDQIPIKERLRLMIPLIENDEQGIFFPFCYMLPPEEASTLKDMLLEKIGTLPPTKPDLRNGLHKNTQALMRTSMRWKVGSYLKKLKEHDKKILEKRTQMESHPPVISSFQEMFKALSSSQPSPTERNLRKKIRVNGRSVSFIHNGEEYILKVRKQNEDMRDHAEIACGLDDEVKDIQENYGEVFYGHLAPELKEMIHELILDKTKNPRISLKAEDLTEEAVFYRVKHTHYFEYLSDPKIPFKDFKMGLKATMEQAFKHMKYRGQFMETFSDISHDETRPGIFLPMVHVIDNFNGLFLGTFKDLKDSFKTVDACLKGMRDLGNSLTCKLKKNMAFSTTYATYLKALYDDMEKEGQTVELEQLILINNMQEALAHTMMTASNLLLIHLSDHPEELKKMTYQQFIKHLEDVLIEPFIRILGSNESLEKLRPFYWNMLKQDFEDFKMFPDHLEMTQPVYRQGDLSRNNYYQSFYRLTYFLMSSITPAEPEEKMDTQKTDETDEQSMDFTNTFEEEDMDTQETHEEKPTLKDAKKEAPR